MSSYRVCSGFSIPDGSHLFCSSLREISEGHTKLYSKLLDGRKVGFSEISIGSTELWKLLESQLCSVLSVIQSSRKVSQENHSYVEGIFQ